MHRLTAIILDGINTSQNKNVPIHEIFYVSLTPYYLDLFDRYYSNVPLNIHDGTFFLQCMNEVKGTKPAG